MSKRRGVIFDLDDTLYAENDYVESGFRSVAVWAARKWKMSTETVHAEFHVLNRSEHRGRVFDAWLSQNEIRECSADILVDVFREHAPSIQPFAPVKQTIIDLRKRFHIGLISDGYLTSQQNKLRALGLHDLFDSVLFSDSLGREHWKPHRLPFDTMIRSLDIPCHEAVYVGDNPKKDFVGARRAGMKSIRMRRGGGVYAHLEPETEEHRPDVEITTWNKIIQTIDQLFSC